MLSQCMAEVLVVLGRHMHGATTTTIANALSGRRLTSRAVGHTLRALERRRLARGVYDVFFGKWLWKLTPAGEAERKRLEHPSERATKTRTP